MTSKKITVITSLILTILGMIVFTFLQFRLYRYLDCFESFHNRELLPLWKQYGITVSSGIFTSAFVTFLISRGDYFYERQRSLERIYLVSEELQREFIKIKYFFPDEPKELVRDLLGEIDSNESCEDHNLRFSKQLRNIDDAEKVEEIYDLFYLPVSHNIEMKFKEYIWTHTKDEEKGFFTDSEMEEEFLEKEYKKKVEKYNKELEAAMKSYIAFSEVRTRELSSAYNDLDFVIANKTIRQHIFEKLYQKQIEQVNMIKKRAYYFNAYFDGNGANKSLLIDWVWELQDSLISEDKNLYYRQYQYDIDCELTQVLVYAYGKVNSEEIPDKKRYIITSKPGWLERITQN